MDSNSICHPSPARKMKCLFLDYFQFLVIRKAGRWTQTSSTIPLQPKNEMLISGLCSTSDDWPGRSIDSNPINHPSPAKEWNAHFCIMFNFWWLARLVDRLKPHQPPLSSQRMKCSFLYYVQFLMISWAGRWTKTPSVTPLQPKKLNACFWIMFNFWWLARLVDGLKRHPPPLSSQRKKCSFLDYVQLLMTSWAGQWTRIPSATPLQPKKWYAHFCITFNFRWLARVVNGLEPHLQPLSNQKYEMLVFGLCSTSDDQPGWSKDSNPSCNLSATNKMKCSFWYYVQFLMISWAGRWTKTPSVTPLQPKKLNACFCITFNFWWSARLVDGHEPHLPPLSRQKYEMLIFGLHSTSYDWQGWSINSNPIHLLSQAKKNEMLIFGLRLTSDDQLGWLMNLNPICHPSPAKKMKCSFLDYFQFRVISQAGRWTQKASTTPLQPRNEMLIFGLRSTSDDQPAWSMDSNPICHPSPKIKMKCSFLDYVQLLMIGRAGQWTQTPSATYLQPKNEMLIFGLRSTSGDWPGWSMDSNAICYPSPAKKKWNAHFWIMFNFWWLAGLVNGLEPIHNPPPAKEWNAHFWIMFNFWWLAGLVNALETHPAPLSSQKNEMLVFGLLSISGDQPGWSIDSNPINHPSPAKEWNAHFCITFNFWWLARAGQWTRTPSATSLQPNIWNACFWITFNFWWSARLAEGLQPHLQPLSNQQNEMLILVLCSTSGDQPGWSMDSNPICHPSPTKKMKCLFLHYI